MAVTVRLSRAGRHKRPFFRIVATDSRSPREGRFLEVLGTYDPSKKEENCLVNAEKVQYWLGQGATISDTVKSLLQKKGLFKKA
ncbi:MAG: 30S ribosomal protein S16 [Nitrospirae bacterium]|nr:30S ribosomal protein S16 [Nitrospirota bacterium]MBI3593491.1 30S ribosomal protein S16 [Nitrospirota bacterium]